jgi:hypothetical protein
VLLSQHGGGEKVNNATLHDVRRERAPVDESLLSCRMLSFWRAQLVDADAIKRRWTQYAGNGAKTPSQAFQACKFAQKTGRSACLNHNLNLNVDAVPVRAVAVAVGCAVRAQHKCLSLSLKMSINFDAFCDHVALAHGRLAIVQEMLESGEVLFEGNQHVALVSAVENGYVDVVDYFLRHAIFDPSARDNSAVRLAAERGHLAVVERLLQDKRVDPSAEDNYALRLAAQKGHVAVVERLLQDPRVDPAADANFAVRRAAYYGYVAVVERLLRDKRVDPSVFDNYAMRMAAENGHPRRRRTIAARPARRSVRRRQPRGSTGCSQRPPRGRRTTAARCACRSVSQQQLCGPIGC